MDLLERAEFFEQLQGTLAEVMDGHGRVALVTGEAGIGKTSLVEQFAEFQFESLRSRVSFPVKEIEKGLGDDYGKNNRHRRRILQSENRQ